MIPRLLAILGILFALFGLMIAPGIMTRARRRRTFAIHRFHPDTSDIPWDLTNWIPVGILDRTGPFVKRDWTWLPHFKRVK